MKENKEEEDLDLLVESNLKILSEPLKRAHTKIGKKSKKTIDEISKEILLVYKQGIKSIFDTPEPKENEVCLIMIFKKNDRFSKLYKPLIDIFGSGLIKPEFELSKINLKRIPKNKKGKEYAGSNVEDFTYLLKEILSEINKSKENLIDLVINNYYKIKKEKNLLLLNDIQRENDNLFYYEDFIFIFCCFIHYFTGLKIKIELSNDKSENIFLFIYGTNDTYELISEFFGFELQLKPYAIKYEEYIKNQNSAKNYKSILLSNKEKSKETPMGEEIKIELKENLIKENENANNINNNEIDKETNNYNYVKNKFTDLQFKDLNIYNKLGFPPYLPFDSNKKEKFRKYEKNDDYHYCENDPDFGKEECTHPVSIFRNIDKLRLIKLSLEDLFQFNDLYQYDFLKTIIYKRNLIDYKEKKPLTSFSYNFISIFDNSNLMDLLNTYRNLYSEYISFYFLWLMHLIHWFLYPIILGIILFALIHSNYIKKIIIYDDNEIKIDLKDIILLSFGGLVIILANLFQKTWKQKEKIFCYFWGMENFSNNEPNNDFIPDLNIDFLFKTKIKTMKTSKFIFRNIISYAILGLVIIIRLVSIHFLFTLQRKWNKDYKTMGKLGYAAVSGCISLIMTQLYKFLSRKLAKWENHKSIINQRNSLTFKVFLFEFFNNYATILYIAFYKPYLDIKNEGKLSDDLSNENNEKFNYNLEIKIHIYVLLLINIGENIVSLLLPILFYFYQTKIKDNHNTNNNEIISNKDNTVKHQMTCFSYDNLLTEYMQKIILFGYINLFFVVEPLAPIFIVIILIIEYLLDLYKVSNYLYIENIGGAKGIEVYNNIIKIMSFMGIMSNGGLILFTKQYQENNNTFKNFNMTELKGIIRSPISIFILFENIILFFISFINIDIKPRWFTHIEKYKSIYKEKYYNRENKKLPHLTSISKKLNE